MGTSVFKKYPLDFDFGGLKVLNMGCGTAKYKSPNVTNVDGYEVCKPDVLWDLEKTPLPFESESYDVIIFNHILEHLNNWWACFEDAARVLKTGGSLIVYVPASGNDSLLGYRDHVSIVNQFSFFGVNGTNSATNAWAETNKKSHVNNLIVTGYHRSYYNKWWIVRAPSWLRKWMGDHLRNVIDEEGFFFKKLGEKK